MESLEPDENAFDTLLLRLWPGVREQCVGASLDEIQELDNYTGQELPPFYRWFLQKMGKDLGPFRFPQLDFTLPTILSKYRSGLVSFDPRYLLIAWHSDRALPNHLFYDLEAGVRDDALVVQRHVDGAIIENQFETLREMFAWRTVLRYNVEMSACVCQGMFTAQSSAPASLLSPALKTLGFAAPVPTGNFCGVYERTDAAIVFSATPDKTPPPHIFFRLGGASEDLLWKILDAIDQAGIQVKTDRWVLDNLNPE